MPTAREVESILPQDQNFENSEEFRLLDDSLVTLILITFPYPSLLPEKIRSFATGDYHITFENHVKRWKNFLPAFCESQKAHLLLNLRRSVENTHCAGFLSKKV